MSRQAKTKQEPPRAKKTGKERAIRHASRVAKPRPLTIRDGRPLYRDDLEDERAWLDW
jgi:hypothetical protein